MGDWVVRLIAEWGYAGVVALMFLETVFPPIPSEIIMSVAGVNAAKGAMGLPGVIVAGTVGAMAGNTVWYALARALGLDRFKPLVDRWGRWLTLDWAEVQRGEKWFAHYDWLFVFIGRMVPTIRSLVSIPAGLEPMRFGPFMLWSTLGTAGWTSALAVAGYLLGARYGEIEDYIGPVSTGVILVLVLWYFWRVMTWRPDSR